MLCCTSQKSQGGDVSGFLDIQRVRLWQERSMLISKPHLYRSESDLVSCLVVSCWTPPAGDLLLYWMLFLLLWALFSSVSVRLSSSSHSSSQKYFLLSVEVKRYLTVMLPPSVLVRMGISALMRPVFPSCSAVEKVNNSYLQSDHNNFWLTFTRIHRVTLGAEFNHSLWLVV